MDPNELADALTAELEDELLDRGLTPPRWAVLGVAAPADLAPDGWFRVALRLDGRAQALDLPAGTVAAYFADEEAAVDEWKRSIGALLPQEDR